MPAPSGRGAPSRSRRALRLGREAGCAPPINRQADPYLLGHCGATVGCMDGAHTHVLSSFGASRARREHRDGIGCARPCRIVRRRAASATTAVPSVHSRCIATRTPQELAARSQFPATPEKPGTYSQWPPAQWARTRGLTRFADSL
eukprot:365032-Chlamydomonas_euryale.AAC.5